MVELRKCYQLGRVAFQAEVKLALESALCVGPMQVHQFLCVSTVSADSLRCHFCKEGSRTFGFDEALLGIIVSQPSPLHALETEYPDSSLLGPRRVDSE
jgi:hypothetical protein